MPKLSIIIPVLNDAASLLVALTALKKLNIRNCEVIVVDGGSSDDSVAVAKAYADHLHNSLPGRSLQMNVGANLSHGEWLMFLHADTCLPKAINHILQDIYSSELKWGRFNIKLSGSHVMLRLVEWMMNSRSRITSVATGDQAIFVRRDLFKCVSGYPEIPLMEDIAFSKKLRAVGKPHCISSKVTTSSRRWESSGIVNTIILMWRLRLAFFFGVSPKKLARKYHVLNGGV